jgi:hypothetical protein
MCVLFTIPAVLAFLNRHNMRETGAETLLSVALAGGVALVFSVLYTFWPQPAASLLIMALLGLLVSGAGLSGSLPT